MTPSHQRHGNLQWHQVVEAWNPAMENISIHSSTAGEQLSGAKEISQAWRPEAPLWAHAAVAATTE
jgi:hypothetical protein